MAFTVFCCSERREFMRSSGIRVRRDAEEWREILRQWKGSGLSRVAFCRREGLAPTTLDKWQRKLRSNPEPGFVELTPSRGRGEWAVEVELPGGVVLRVRG
jgi:transposase-like protein